MDTPDLTDRERIDQLWQWSIAATMQLNANTRQFDEVIRDLQADVAGLETLLKEVIVRLKQVEAEVYEDDDYAPL